ncbi:MAG: hypothetical protein NWF01_03510 [Candidatus Bathyarchaeota archaeon]|nr:hypothetical protein [Candidatus Bathyarchaeota archaeon]
MLKTKLFWVLNIAPHAVRGGLIRFKQYRIKQKITNKNAKIIIADPLTKIKITKEENAKFIVNGILKFYDFNVGGNSLIQIYLGKNATFQIDGNFVIGKGVKISVEKEGILYIGGDKAGLHSGISCDTRIMVLKHVEIGSDFGCSWNVFITDSDWHYVEYDGKPTSMQSDVKIGDRVWVCPECSILKGTVINDGCIIGTKSLLNGKTYPSNSLVAGIPAKVVMRQVKWRRELPISS